MLLLPDTSVATALSILYCIVYILTCWRRSLQHSLRSRSKLTTLTIASGVSIELLGLLLLAIATGLLAKVKYTEGPYPVIQSITENNVTRRMITSIISKPESLYSAASKSIMTPALYIYSLGNALFLSGIALMQFAQFHTAQTFVVRALSLGSIVTSIFITIVLATTAMTLQMANSNSTTFTPSVVLLIAIQASLAAIMSIVARSQKIFSYLGTLSGLVYALTFLLTFINASTNISAYNKTAVDTLYCFTVCALTVLVLCSMRTYGLVSFDSTCGVNAENKGNTISADSQDDCIYNPKSNNMATTFMAPPKSYSDASGATLSSNNGMGQSMGKLSMISHATGRTSWTARAYDIGNPVSTIQRSETCSQIPSIYSHTASRYSRTASSYITIATPEHYELMNKNRGVFPPRVYSSSSMKHISQSPMPNGAAAVSFPVRKYADSVSSATDHSMSMLVQDLQTRVEPMEQYIEQSIDGRSPRTTQSRRQSTTSILNAIYMRPPGPPPTRPPSIALSDDMNTPSSQDVVSQKKISSRRKNTTNSNMSTPIDAAPIITMQAHQKRDADNRATNTSANINTPRKPLPTASAISDYSNVLRSSELVLGGLQIVNGVIQVNSLSRPLTTGNSKPSQSQISSHSQAQSNSSASQLVSFPTRTALSKAPTNHPTSVFVPRSASLGPKQNRSTNGSSNGSNNGRIQSNRAPLSTVSTVTTNRSQYSTSNISYISSQTSNPIYTQTPKSSIVYNSRFSEMS